MVDNTLALQVKGPDIMNSFNAGVQARQGQQMNSLRMDSVRQDMAIQGKEAGRKEAMELMTIMGSIGLGAMGGKIDGEVDPEKWVQGMDFLKSEFNLETDAYRDNPGLAPMLVNASITAAQRIQAAQNDREFNQSLVELQLEIDKANDAARKPQSPVGKLAADRTNGLITPEEYEAAVTKQNASGKPKLSATELKAVYAAEDDLPNLDNSIAQLKRALTLNEKAYSGFGASTRGTIGAKGPANWTPDWLGDPDSGAATSEYEAIMTGEAAGAMSAALKGATTDRELGIFMDIIGDVSKPPEVRKNAINRLLELAKAKRETAARRIEELKGSGPASATGEAAGIEPGTVDGGYRFIGGDPTDESNWEPE